MINRENGCDESMGRDDKEKAGIKESIQQTIYNVSSGGQVYVANDNGHINVGVNQSSSNRNNIIQAEKFKNTEPLPAKADRFSLLLKQPKVFALNVIFFHLLLILFQSYQSCFSLVGLDFECRL